MRRPINRQLAYYKTDNDDDDDDDDDDVIVTMSSGVGYVSVMIITHDYRQRFN